MTARAIDAAWPEWWSAEASISASAGAELRYTLARRLGLRPGSLFDGQPTFVWRDEAKFKSLTAGASEKDAITSFGMALGRMVLTATPVGMPSAVDVADPLALRAAILDSSRFVSLREVLAVCWSLGIPVVHAAIFPLRQKRMHAMTISIGGRSAIILGRVSPFTAQLAYVIAHELGHILLGHLDGTAAVVEMGDPLRAARNSADSEEVAADRYALTVLTGSPEPLLQTTIQTYSAAELAASTTAAADVERVDPGVLALCMGHATGRWKQTFGALKIIPPGPMPLPATVNQFAVSQLDLALLPTETDRYVRRVLGLVE